MSRPGVTFQDIATTAHKLKGEGKNITIENIRSHLGTGSIGTINKYLRQWREMEKSTGQLTTNTQLPESLTSIVQTLWENILTQSIQRFEPIEDSYNQEIKKLKSELEKYRTNNQRWQKLFSQWQAEKSALEKELELAYKKNQSLLEK